MIIIIVIIIHYFMLVNYLLLELSKKHSAHD